MNFKSLIVISALCWAFHASAQSIPNAGFENWTNFGGWYDNPIDWQTNNSQIFAPVAKDLNAHQGLYALQINPLGYAKSKFPISQSVSLVTFFTKCNLISGDSIYIKVFAYNNNSLLDSNVWVNKNQLPNWTFQSIIISQHSTTIDALEIRIYGGSKTNTTASFDDFDYILTQISEIETQKEWQIFPIPIMEQSILKFENTKRNPYTFVLYDSQGHLVRKTNTIKNDFLIIEKGDLLKGLYYFKLLSTKGLLLANGKILVD